MKACLGLESHSKESDEKKEKECDNKEHRKEQ